MAVISREPLSIAGPGNFVPLGAYSLLDSLLVPGDGQTCTSGLAGTQISANISSITPLALPVNSVTVRYRGRVLADGPLVARSLSASLQIGSTQYTAEVYSVGGQLYTEDTDWAYYEFVYDVSPVTEEAWTVEGVQGIGRIILRTNLAGGTNTADFEVDHFQVVVDYGGSGEVYNVPLLDNLVLTDVASPDPEGVYNRPLSEVLGLEDVVGAVLEEQPPSNVYSTRLTSIQSPGPWTTSYGPLEDALAEVDGVTAFSGLADANLYGVPNLPLVPGEIVWVRQRVTARVVVDLGLNQIRRNLATLMTMGSGPVAHPNPYLITDPEWQEYLFTWPTSPETGLPWQAADLATIARVYLRAYSAGGGQDADVEVDQFVIEVGYNANAPTSLNVTLEESLEITDTRDPQSLVIDDDAPPDPVVYERFVYDQVTGRDGVTLSSHAPGEVAIGAIRYGGQQIVAIYLGRHLIWQSTP